MHGEHLHPVRVDVDLAGREAVLHGLGGGQERQQSGESRRLLIAVLRDHLGEGVEMLAPARVPRRTTCPRLHVDPEHSLDVGDQIGKRLTEPVAQ